MSTGSIKGDGRTIIRTRRSKWRRRAVGAMAGAIVAVPAAGGAGWWYLNHQLDRAKRVDIPAGILHVSKPGAPFNLLLIGSDSRQFESDGSSSSSSRFGSSSVVTGQRSDVIIVARVVPATKQVYLLSIPRDLWVDIPGNVQYVSGQNKINAAFNTGPGLLVQTIKKDLGIPIDHFAEINFAGFQQMVTAVGGIRIDFPDQVKDPYTGLDIDHTGCQLISGGMALAYVRSRHLEYDADGVWTQDYGSDWSRIRRQDVFFRALLDQVKAKVSDPFAMQSLLSATVSNLTIDSTLTNSDLLHLALEFDHISTGSLHSEVLPTIPDVTPSGEDVLLPATGPDAAMIRSFLAIGTSSTSSGTSAGTTSSSAASGATASGAATSGAAGSTSTTSTSTTTTTAASSGNSGVVYDTQPEPWNGKPC